MKEGYPFNVRVYGLLYDRTGTFLLLSEETISGKKVVKFPGGGLRYGEGPEDCVVREFREETGAMVSVGEHFYTTGFFQPSAFGDNAQVISIYYLLQLQDRALEKSFVEGEIRGKESNEERFFWKQVSRIGAEDFDLPIDQEVARRISKELTG